MEKSNWGGVRKGERKRPIFDRLEALQQIIRMSKINSLNCLMRKFDYQYFYAPVRRRQATVNGGIEKLHVRSRTTLRDVLRCLVNRRAYGKLSPFRLALNCRVSNKMPREKIT